MSPCQARTQYYVCFYYSPNILGIALGLGHFLLLGQKLGECGAIGNLLDPQTVKLPVANSIYPLTSVKKQHRNLATTLSCLNIEATSTERL
jgi:hypothetical protein